MYSGYNELAESNSLVIVYPMLRVSMGNPTNARGCWDFTGYNDYSYD